MKNIFEKPEVQIVLIGQADIITASGETTEEDDAKTFGYSAYTSWRPFSND